MDRNPSSSGAITITTSNDATTSSIGMIGGLAYSGASGIFHGVTVAAASTADATSQATRSALASQFNTILMQIDNMSADSSYNRVNLLAGEQLSLTFNETGKSELSITGVDGSFAGLGLSKLVSGTSFIDNASTNSTLSTLNSVSTKLRSEASALVRTSRSCRPSRTSTRT